jgi:hypothetical protein
MPPKQGKKRTKKKTAKPSSMSEKELAEQAVDPATLAAAAEAQRETVAALEDDVDTMRSIRGELATKLDVQLFAESHIISYLNLEITEKRRRIRALEGEQDVLETEETRQRRYHRNVAHDVEVKHREELQQLKEDLDDLKDSYRKVEPFTGEKATLEHELRNFEDKFETEKRDHTIHVSDLERRNVLEKDRLKNEMLRKIRETKLSLLSMTEDQLHTTTKRTIMENEQMNTELDYQSARTVSLLKVADGLEASNKTLKRQLELDDDERRLLMQRGRTRQRQIGKLTARLRELEAINVRNTASANAAAVARMEEERSSASLINTLEERAAVLEDERRQLVSERQIRLEELAAARVAYDETLGSHDEGVTVLMSCVDDVRRSVAVSLEIDAAVLAAPAVNDDGSDNDAEGNGGVGMRFPELLPHIAEREQVLNLIFHKLNEQSTNQQRLFTQEDVDRVLEEAEAVRAHTATQQMAGDASADEESRYTSHLVEESSFI